MMTKSKRLLPAAEVAENREKAMAKVFGQCQQQLFEVQKSLQELLGYREEYSKRFEMDSKLGMNANRLQDFRMFLHKLNQGIEQQLRVIQAATRERDKRKQEWLLTRTRKEAIGKVVERFAQEELRKENQKEQKDIDEIARNLARFKDQF